LIAGLLSLDEPLEVVMLVGRGDQALAAPVLGQSKGRLQVVPPPTMQDRWLHQVEAARRTRDAVMTAIHRLVSRANSLLARGLRALVAGARQGNWPARVVIALGIAGAPIGFLGLWVLYAGFRLAIALLRGGSYLFRILARVLRRVSQEKIHDPVAAAHACACDVWLIPFAGFPHRLNFPAVLAIHDLIHVHFPDTQDPQSRRITDQAFRDRAAEATLCACMSTFIRDHDLEGVLHLPPEKIRVIRPALPGDLSCQGMAPAIQPKPVSLTRPYVFYPSTFRPYKNHQVLIEALHWLSSRHRENEIDLVFTGISAVPEPLERLIRAYGLKEHVHILGRVDRSMLGGLYLGAIATIVPSLYEQGSFPIYEALHWKCPVACSDIPSLREQCAAMGDAMLYFNPRDPEAIARLILNIANDRETIAARQHAASRVLWQRTWSDVAREWLVVFREAVEIARRSSAPRASERTAA
jgi:glycosyltransferase involved in cell wall biosynthesis